MLLLAWFAYQQIVSLYLHRDELRATSTADETHTEQAQVLPSVLVGALPLMGLLGTIMGLQGSFTEMMTHGADSQVVSRGIADALFTTQLGLVLAIPGWLLMMLVKSTLRQPNQGSQHE